MPKILRARLEKKTGRHAADIVNRWRFETRGNRCEIDVFTEEDGKWVRVGVVMGAPGIPAESLAGYVVRVLNEKQQESVVLEEALHALQTLLQEGVTYTTEMEADHAVRRLKEQSALLREVQEVLDLVIEQGITEGTTEKARQTLADLKNSKIIANQF